MENHNASGSRSRSPTLSPIEETKEIGEESKGTLKSARQEAIDQVSPRARAMLLFVFCAAQFLETALGAGMLIATSQISVDLGLALSQSIWIVTAYMLTYAAFTLFAGRVSDLFSAPIVFEAALVAFGLSSLINSFLGVNKYAFLIVRTICGTSAAFTIPPMYNLLAAFYPGQPKKMGLPGLAACLGGIMGLVLAGLCMLASWKWFFRLVAIIALACAGVAAFLLPFNLPPHDPKDRLKRLDVPGVILLGGALVCFLLSLSEGPLLGWDNPHFYVPLIVSIFAFAAFGVWESVIPARTAALPMVFWKATNTIPASLATILCASLVTVIQLDFSNYWQGAMGWSSLHVAAGLIPLLLTGIVLIIAFQKVTYLTARPRWVVLGTLPLNIIAWLLFYFSDLAESEDRYWKYSFTCQIIGCIGGFTIYLSAAANLIASFPPESGGVAGAFIVSITQVAQSIYLAVVGGLSKSDVHDWRTTFGRVAFFGIPMNIVLTLQYVVFYRDINSFEEEHAEMRAKIAQDKGLKESLPVDDLGRGEAAEEEAKGEVAATIT